MPCSHLDSEERRVISHCFMFDISRAGIDVDSSCHAHRVGILVGAAEAAMNGWRVFSFRFSVEELNCVYPQGPGRSWAIETIAQANRSPLTGTVRNNVQGADLHILVVV